MSEYGEKKYKVKNINTRELYKIEEIEYVKNYPSAIKVYVLKNYRTKETSRWSQEWFATCFRWTQELA